MPNQIRRDLRRLNDANLPFETDIGLDQCLVVLLGTKVGEHVGRGDIAIGRDSMKGRAKWHIPLGFVDKRRILD